MCLFKASWIQLNELWWVRQREKLPPAQKSKDDFLCDQLTFRKKEEFLFYWNSSPFSESLEKGQLVLWWQILSWSLQIFLHLLSCRKSWKIQKWALTFFLQQSLWFLVYHAWHSRKGSSKSSKSFTRKMAHTGISQNKRLILFQLASRAWVKNCPKWPVCHKKGWALLLWQNVYLENVKFEYTRIFVRISDPNESLKSPTGFLDKAKTTWRWTYKRLMGSRSPFGYRTHNSELDQSQLKLFPIKTLWKEWLTDNRQHS